MKANEENTSAQRSNVGRSVYRRGAEDGLWFGAYLSVLMLAILMTVHVELLSLLAVAMILGVPFLVYKTLRRGIADREDGGRFAEACMHGISIFFFGALIMGVAMYVYLRFADPSYLPTNIKQLIAALRQSGTAEDLETARQLQNMIDRKLLPGAIQMVFGTIWMVVFSGTMLTMLLSAFAINQERRRKIAAGTDKNKR